MRLACIILEDSSDWANKQLGILKGFGYSVLPKYTSRKEEEDKQNDVMYKSKEEIDWFDKVELLSVNGEEILPRPRSPKSVVICTEKTAEKLEKVYGEQVVMLKGAATR